MGGDMEGVATLQAYSGSDCYARSYNDGYQFEYGGAYDRLADWMGNNYAVCVLEYNTSF